MLTEAHKVVAIDRLASRGLSGPAFPLLALSLSIFMLTWIGLGQASADTNSSPRTGTQAAAIPKSSATPERKLSGPADCGNWDIVSSPNIETGDSELFAVEAVSESDIWAVGLYGYTANIANTLIEHWDGIAWSIVPSPNFGPGDNLLYGVAAVSGTDVWAVGYYSESYGGAPLHVLIEHWDGSVWDIIPGPDPQFAYLKGVTAIAVDDVWAVGTYQDSTTGQENSLVEHWDGSAWSIIPSPNFGPGDDNILRGVTAISGSDIWAVGTYYNPTVGQTLVEHWDGSAWSIISSPNLGSGDNLLLAVAAVSPSDVWSVGEYYAASGAPTQTLVEHWDGSAWTVVPSPNFGSSYNHLGGVAVSGSEVWAVGYYCNPGICHTLVEHWDGSAWNVVPSPSPQGYSDYLGGVEAVSGSDLWAVGYYYGDGSRTYTLVEHYLTICPTSTPQPTQTPGGPTATPTLPAACTIQFSDVPQGSTFYPYVRCMACQGIINGYPCGGVGEPCNGNNDPYFRPGNDVTRGQFAKITANAAGYNDTPGAQQYEDVLPGSTFYDFIWRLSDRGLVNGYPCGGPGEPCGPNNLPYFRPNANITRGQLSKIDANAAGYNDTPGAQQYEDVLPGSTFYDYIWRLSDRGLVNGYPCGGPGEACGPFNLPYFRPGSNATRGQASKIVSNTFFPNCQSVGGPEQ
jgi:S-layer homology domain